MTPSETVIPVASLNSNHSSSAITACTIVSRKRLKMRKMGSLTCHEEEVEDLLSEGEST